jgi:hypothetical protein
VTGHGNSEKSDSDYVRGPACPDRAHAAILPEPNVNVRVRSGEATLEKPTLAKAHQVVTEKLGRSQPHDPNAVQFPDIRAR